MKLKLQFGLSESGETIDWWQPIENFPGLVLFKGNKWEFVVYDPDETGEVDYTLIFSQVKGYHPNWYATTYVDISDMLKSFDNRCQCGSAHGGGHMFFCPKWSKY